MMEEEEKRQDEETLRIFADKELYIALDDELRGKIIKVDVGIEKIFEGILIASLSSGLLLNLENGERAVIPNEAIKCISIRLPSKPLPPSSGK